MVFHWMRPTRPPSTAGRHRQAAAAIEHHEVTVRVGATYPLSDICNAYQALVSRAIIGQVVLLRQQGV